MTSLGSLMHRDAAEEVRTLRSGACIAAWEANGGGPSNSATTATFDSLTDEFIIDTPSDVAVKVGVIGSPDTGTRYAVVTARLITHVLVTDGRARPDGDRTRLDCGVHAFLCPLRRRDGSATPGVAVSETGHWRGLPGVRTGTVRFLAVRVPRSALLTGLGVSVSRSGEYHSPYVVIAWGGGGGGRGRAWLVLLTRLRCVCHVRRAQFRLGAGTRARPQVHSACVAHGGRRVLPRHRTPVPGAAVESPRQADGRPTGPPAAARVHPCAGAHRHCCKRRNSRGA